MEKLSRRACLGVLGFVSGLQLPAQKQPDPGQPADWTCPMDADVHLDQPGKCPRCGMTLVLKVPDATEYLMSLTVEPKRLEAGDEATLLLRVADASGHPVQAFDVVHEKLLHLFIVSEDLQFFAHVHPVVQDDHSFSLRVRLPKAGMYRLLADYFPAGGTPQLTVETVYVSGRPARARLMKSAARQVGENLSAVIRLAPEPLLAGLQSRLFYELDPVEGLEKYLGAWGHMLIVSEDMVDLMHLHPALAQAPTIQYNVIFPRSGRYKVWSQFQRRGVVNTIASTVEVKEI